MILDLQTASLRYHGASMPQAIVNEVSTPAERDAFIKFPWQIYRNDPVWVPPLIIERREFLNPKKHPFYQHGAAAQFLARAQGDIVGRIMASDDPRYNELHGSNIGCFGMFECIDDAEVAGALFRAAGSWLRARGRSELMGPIDYSTNYLCGLLIDGFQHPPMILTPHNPPYYKRLLEAHGFAKAIDFHAWWIEDAGVAAGRLGRFAARFEKRAVAQIRSIDLRHVATEAARLRQLYNDAWQQNWGFVPFTAHEFEHMAKELRAIVDPSLTLIAEVGNEPAGFVLALPDINVVLKTLNGRLTRFGLPIGLAKLLFYRRRIKTWRLVALGVASKFRKHGVAEILVWKVVERAMLKKGLVGECSLVLEDNTLMNRFLAAIGAKPYKTYRIYSRRLS